MTMKIDQVMIIIPAYNPDEKLVTLVSDLNKKGFENIICVNDGSSSSGIFREISDRCTVLEHDRNYGKGHALKTAFWYIQEKCEAIQYCITVDADGQHDIPSIMKCLEAVPADDKESFLLLGSREIRETEGQKIPLRSRFGNAVTRLVTQVLCGFHISDTQTGLRVCSADLLPMLLKVEGERYEYEMNMLFDMKKAGIRLMEVPIETIYEDGNKSSHFHPIRDSIRIYYTIIKYLLVSIFSVLIDYGLFMLLMYTVHGVWIATYGARLCSSVVNFVLNRSFVFRAEKKHLVRQIVLYYIQVVVIAGLSAACVAGLKMLVPEHVLLCKIVVDTLLFLLNYFLQKKFIFR